jgi:hypothetical protein
VLNLLQSYCTELWHDEAYYWVFAQHLDWGYKDHPPLVAALVAAGYALFKNELGVRLFMVLASTGSLWLLWKMVRPASKWLFFSLTGSILMVQVGGYVAVPDVPLLFFTVLYFYLLRQYLERDSWWTALGIALTLACMAYAKYHGALVLIFTLLPNLGLLRRPSAWLIPVVVGLLLTPHLLWQWQNDFPTFRYHFIDRKGEHVYEWRFITDYLLGQVLVWGPLISIPAFIGAVRYRGVGSFERTLKWVFYGTFGFFLLQSFGQRIEANWTAIALVPVVYFAVRQAERVSSFRKWCSALFVPSLLLMLLLRVYFVWDFLPKGLNPRNEFHGWDKWAADLADIAGDKPVVFLNRYQKPSKYLFYAQKSAHVLTVNEDTGTQFDLLTGSEEAVQGKSVYLMVDFASSIDKMDTVVTLPRSGRRMGYNLVDNFRSYNRVRISIDHGSLELPPDTTVSLQVTILNPTANTVRFDTTGARGVELKYNVLDGLVIVKHGTALAHLPFGELRPGEAVRATVQVGSPGTPGKYRYRLAFHTGGLYTGRNSVFQPMVVRRR